MKYELLIVAALLTLSVVLVFDFIVYVLRPAPKVSYFSKIYWRIAFFAIIALVYYVLNGMKFLG